MDELPDLLATYIAALERGSAAASPREHAIYQRRLAAAADIKAALQPHDPKELKRLIDQETHAAGWGFLEESLGAAAEAAFAKFGSRARMSGATFAA